MNYEEENNKLRNEIKDLDRRIEELVQLKQNPSKLTSQRYCIRSITSYDNMPDYYEQIEIKKNIDQKINYLKGLRNGKIEILNESPGKRKLRNTIITTVETLGLDKIPEPPRHVSGRVYEVSDGCATWCLWFLIIDAIGVGLYFLLNQ